MADDQIGHPDVSLSGTSKGVLPADKNFLLFAKIDESLSTITRVRVVFATREKNLELNRLLGVTMKLEMNTQQKNKRRWSGTVISAEYLGLAAGYEMFALDIRPWLWFLTRRVNTRILQEMTTAKIVETVCGDLGFTWVDTGKLSGGRTREFTIQYDETDFSFLSRLLEEDGIHYYFDYSGDVEKLVLCDANSSHDPIKENATLEFMPQEEEMRREKDHIFGWKDRQRNVPGKVSLVDYEFTTPTTKLDVTMQSPKGKHEHNDIEIYTMGGHYSKVQPDGEAQATVRLERAVQDYERWFGLGNASTLATGATFKLTKHERTSKDTDFLIISAVYHIQADLSDPKVADIAKAIIASEETPSHHDLFRCEFEVMRKTDPFRPPAVTPWPDMSGLHTATVTGPSGEEIYTDKYGRIKVQFHWDRDGQKDQNTTCWIRVSTPWAGKNWGMIHIPRIGQEVIVQFERGDPDHPICTGMLFNAVNMPPYALPDNMTQSGIKTHSSKQGGDANFNELMFEDKKGNELVRFQAEKDYYHHVKNNVTETYGNNHTYKLEHNLEETIVEGYMKTELQKGDKAVWLTEGMLDTWLKKGDAYMTIDEGDFGEELGKGNYGMTVKDGDYSVTVEKGIIYLEASDEISLVCGDASIWLKSDGTIEIKGKDITIDGSGTIKNKAGMNFEAKASMSAKVQGSSDGTFDGGGMTTIKGGMVNIN